jgi:colicin import membrane protein
VDFYLHSPSGRPDFDASTLKALHETQQQEDLPQPPTNDLLVFRINFNSQELQQ